MSVSIPLVNLNWITVSSMFNESSLRQCRIAPDSNVRESCHCYNVANSYIICIWCYIVCMFKNDMLCSVVLIIRTIMMIGLDLLKAPPTPMMLSTMTSDPKHVR